MIRCDRVRGPRWIPKLTKKTVDGAKPIAKEFFVWDNEFPGFGLRVFPSGRKSYLVQYRKAGRTRRFTIGLHGPITPDKARKTALSLLGGIADGGDPAEKKLATQKDITVAELCELYLEHGCGTKKASTIGTDRGRIERHIKPLLGKRRIHSITRADIEKFMKDVADGKTKTDVKTVKYGRAIVEGGKGTATRTVGLLGGIFSFAVASGLRDDNPVRGVKRFPDKKYIRFLSKNELTILGAALDDAEGAGINPNAVAALRLLVLTGCRKSEVLSLKWDYVDWSNCCLRLPESKSGQKIVPLGKPAVDLLQTHPRQENNPFVFPGGMYGGHLVGLQKIWEALRSKAKLDDVRIHDLRHSFASMSVLGGDSLIIIGALLGHKDPKTTQIYAHLGDNVLKDAADKVSQEIAKSMGIGKSDEIGQTKTDGLNNE